MVQINFARKSVQLKVVYYGPGMSGKTTNLEIIHQRAPEGNRGQLTSISTDGDRTLFFDFMPLDLGTVAGMRTAFQIYTVPGQVYYNATRKLVLQGVDGIIFVADSSPTMIEQNLESLRDLEENLNEYGKGLATLPHVIQLNKRDLPDAMPVEELARILNPHGAPLFEAIASSGEGVFPTLKALASSVLKNIMNESEQKGSKPVAMAPHVHAPLPQPRAAAQAPYPQAVAAAHQPAPYLQPVHPGQQYGARTELRPNLGVPQSSPQMKPAAARPQRTQGPSAKPRSATQEAKAANAERFGGRMAPVFALVGAGVGALLVWIVMKVL